jgi:2-desacetyl-2-hydroxyethyl bacteriochlorophyllide A dehydrogenase
VHYPAGGGLGGSIPRRAPLRAAVLTRPHRVHTTDIPEPVPGPGEALVEVRSVGLCGTDRKIFAGLIPVAYPRIMGHEVAGEVIAAPQDSPVSEGTRVLVDPGITCGRCPQCLAGRGNICTGGWLLGRDRDGGLGRAIAVPAVNLHPLPPEVGTDVAPLVQVLATCMHGQRLVPVFPGTAVLILGLGVTGLLHLQLAKLRGAWPVVCMTRSAEKLDVARALGADAVVRAGEPGDVERVLEATGGGADVVIECAGFVETLARAVELARVGGRILAFGTITEAQGPFPFYDLYFKELAMVSPRSAAAEDFPLALDAVAQGHVHLAPLVSQRFPLSGADEALAAAGAPGALKVFVDP